MGSTINDIQMTFRKTLRMTFKTWDFRGVSKEDFEGDFKGVFQEVFKKVFKGEFEGSLERDMEVDFKGDSKGHFKWDSRERGFPNRTWKETYLLSSSGQVRSRSGLFQVWLSFSLQLKFNSLELDSVVRRLVRRPYLIFEFSTYLLGCSLLNCVLCL